MKPIDDRQPIREPYRRTRHAVVIDGEPPDVWPSVRGLDLRASLLVRALFTMRGMGGVTRIEDLDRLGFRVLESAEPDWFCLGLIGRPWRPRGDLVRFEPFEFAAFDRPGYAKITWSFALAGLGPATRLVTETRILCTDESSRRRFGWYWWLIGPFSSLIRSRVLAMIKRAAEAT